MKHKCIYDEWSGRIPTCSYGQLYCDYDSCKYYTPEQRSPKNEMVLTEFVGHIANIWDTLPEKDKQEICDLVCSFENKNNNEVNTL